MKKKYCIALLLAFCLCLCLSPMALAEEAAAAETPAPAEEAAPAETPAPVVQQAAAEKLGYVTDQPDLLTQEEEKALEARASAMTEKYSCGVYIVIVRDFRDFNVSEVGACAEGLYSYYDLGFGPDRDGLLLLLSMNDRDYALTSYGYYADYCFGDHNKDLVERAFLDNFRSNDWAGGLSDYLSVAEDVLATAAAHQLTINQENQSFAGLTYSDHTYKYGVVYRMPVALKLLIGIGIPCLIALGVCSTFKAQMKTAHQRTTAEEYVVPGSADLLVQEDRFLNRTESRVPIQSSSSSSGRGGSGGGGGFHTHTGKF